MNARIATARSLEAMVRRPCARSLLARFALALGLAVPLAIGIAAPAQADSWRDDRRRGAKHHDRHHHGPRATIVVRPAWSHHHRPSYAPAPRVVYHRHPRWVPAYGPGFHCQPWEGPVWNGRHYEHAYGTVCLMPDGTWQLMG